MNIAIIFALIWFIIIVAMAAFYRKVWVLLAGSSASLFIISAAACKDVPSWVIITGIVCLPLALPSFLQDYKTSKIQSLKDDIAFIQNVKYQSASKEEQELDRLENLSIKQLAISWVRRK